MHELRISFTGNESLISTITSQIADYSKLAGFKEDAVFRIQVVVAEAINNVISYATPTVPVMISCMFDDSEKTLIIDMIDNGSPIETTPSYEFPQGNAESGRGWPIIFNWMDDVSHLRQGDENHLTMKKNLI